MSTRRKSKRQEEQLALSGNAKALNKIARFFLFPVFHPVKTIIVLVLLWLVPTFLGAKPNNVHNWYAKKITTLFEKQLFMPVADNKTPSLKIKRVAINGVEEIKSNNIPANDANNRRKIFLKAVSNQKAYSDNVRKAFEEKESLPRQEIVSLDKKDVSQKNFGLNYLKTPEVLKGEVTVINANQFLMNDKYMFLYGIYVDPASKKGKETQDYLTSLLKNKITECSVVAYSDGGAATAYCKVDGMLINKMLVDQGYSKDVYLGK